MGWLMNDRNLFLSCGSWKAKIRVPAGLGSGEALFQVADHRLLTVSSGRERRTASSLVSSYRSTDSICEGSTHIT